MQIGKKDIAWNFAGTMMRVASGVILLPLVLRHLSKEDVGLWNIYLQIGGLALLLDFGFQGAFGRNITYIFSGVKELKAEGFNAVGNNDKSISYPLLKSVIRAMRTFYGILALIFLLIFVGASPFYLKSILRDYHGGTDTVVIWTSWIIYGFLVAYQLYTYYYSSLLIGRGMVKKQQQIYVIGQSFRILASIILLMMGYGIISMVVGQLVSDIFTRVLSYNAFYDKDIRSKLKEAIASPVKDIMRIMTPNATKIGITTLGWFLTSKVIIIIAPLLSISLATVGSYGTTMTMVNLIMSLSTLWSSTFYPKLTLYRVNNQLDDLKRVYIKGQLSMVGVYLICGAGLILVGPTLLHLIKSNTPLLPSLMIIVILLVAMLESNFGLASSFILAGNQVPYMKSSILTGIFSQILLLSMLKFTALGTWAMIIAPGVAAAAYQNWKWPLVAHQQLQLKFNDYFQTSISTIKELTGKKS
ncbi:MAG: hypothetical protein RIS29_2362 [Bacteroidota bacterium]|jgi:O-antigen/teichoic acid export membrane protein